MQNSNEIKERKEKYEQKEKRRPEIILQGI